VIFIDLDRFKQINDQLGHWAGDRALIVVAERLANVLRSNDLAARLGGDEFIVLIVDIPSPGIVEEIALRITEVMNEDLQLGEERLKIGASVGISEFPADGLTAEELLLKADAAMYAAKSSRCGIYRRYQELASPGAVS
jgi:diguanylate cyclase (GGDEF)-like protein